MAVNVVIPLLIPLEEDLHNSTRLLTGEGAGPLEFTEPRYCALMHEDSSLGASVVGVVAVHSKDDEVRYSITGGNRDGLFTIDQRSGVITLAAALDYEIHDRHELVVAAEAGGATVHTIVQVRVADVNDNAPYFLRPEPVFTVIEEDDRDLPSSITTVEARDKDWQDKRGLLYTLSGDGVDGFSPSDAFFSIDALTGELIQQRALDRDPPRGRHVWKVRVQVRDGQALRSGTPGGDHHQAPPHSHSRRPRHTERKSQRGRTLDSREGEREKTGEDEREKRKEKQHQDVETLKETSAEFFVNLQSEPVTNEDELMKLKKTANMTGSGDGAAEEITRRLQTSQMNQTIETGSKNVLWVQRTESSPTKGFPSWPGKKVSKEQKNRHSKAVIPFPREWFEEDQSYGTEVSYSEDQQLSPESSRYTAKETKTGKRLSTGKQVGILHSRTLGIQWKAGRSLKSRKSRQTQQLRSARVGSLTGSSSGVLGALHKRNFSVSVTELGKRRVPQQTHLAAEDSAAFVSEDCVVKEINSHNDKAFTMRSQVAENISSTETHTTTPYSLVREGESTLNTEEKDAHGLRKTEKSTPATRPKWLHQGNRRESKLNGQNSYAEAAPSSHLCLGEDCGNKATSSPHHSNEDRTDFPAWDDKTEKTRKSKAPNTKFKTNPLRNTLKNDKLPRRRTRRSNQDPNTLNDTPSIRHRREAARFKKGKKTSTPGHAYDPTTLREDEGTGAGVGGGGGGGGGGGCGDVFGGELQDYNVSRTDGGGRGWVRRGRVHLVETVVTLLVKDINDNPPVFPNTTMFGEVQENGPIDLSVGVIAAWDADDTSEGTNAKLMYSIEKNVIHERTGEAIFRVNPETGLIQTALCCLDRETTPEYHIQVVATDGGGLKGTGTVVVRLADVNDNSPRLARQLWELEVDETWGKGPPNDTTILEVSAADRDTSNYFFYRVVEASGWGWEHFSMRSVGAVGQLYAVKTLDFENDTHRRGFRFMVQVTDRGRGGWTDPRHLDAAWVSITLRDVNDNPPQFHRPHAHVTVREDAAPGTLLAALPAQDPDMDGTQGVDYHVAGGWGALTVNDIGDVSLWRALDREAPGGAIAVAEIIGVDRGSPPLSATATLTITVTDVNDCAPTLLPPTILHVAEGSPPTLLGVLAATDHDVWALGHGPPFNLSLAPTNPAHVFSHISLTFDSHLDSGRGGAELWTAGPVDREQYPELMVSVVVGDARGLAATHTVTVIIDDLNDNPMRPAAKTVYLWKTQGGGSDAPLGRIYVNDPDDWDLNDKTFSWMASPHPLFSLNPDDGTIYASSHVREGRYDLQFAVSDRVWGQTGVAANVTVAVRLLSPDALGHATAVILTPTTPEQFTQGWTPVAGGGGLGRLVEAVGKVIGKAGHTIEVVSVYNLQHPSHTTSRSESHHTTEAAPHHTPPAPTTTPDLTTHHSDPPTRPSPLRPSTCVWVSVREEGRDRFMDPVKLQGLLGLHTFVLEETTGLTVVVEDPAAASPGVWTQDLQEHVDPPRPAWDTDGAPDLSSAATRASTTLPLQVVDTNTTALVTPRLTRSLACHAHEPETCTASSCLNGGRCVGTTEGNRCVCPQGSWGTRCKVLSRTFSGSGWAWVRRLPPCLPVTASLRVLTRRPSGLLLYSGPLAPHPRHPNALPTPMLALELHEGRPQLMVEGGDEPLKLVINTTIHDGNWHSIHLHLHPKGAVLLLDLCGRGWDDDQDDDSHCVKRASWVAPSGSDTWGMSLPLQVGGLAHTPPHPQDHGWLEAPSSRPLDGCISHLTLNGQLVDLGEPAYSMGSRSGCSPQSSACPGGVGVCGYRGECVGGLNQAHCECHAGWTGPACSTPTLPVTLAKASYLKMALSFTPAPRELKIQLRLRTRGPRSGFLVHLAAHHRSAAFTLHLRAGVACASMSGAGWAARVACVEGRPVGDGSWHTVRAERRGHNLILGVDDGDGWRRNESLVSLLPLPAAALPPTPLLVDKHDGVSVGGIPEFSGVKLITVHDDLHDTCVDDLRVSDRSLPLPPAVNGTSWAQITTSEGVEEGCHAQDACSNTTCTPPLTCTSNWGHATCSCGSGRHLVGQSCKDVDECVWQPCLHGGTCYNLRPGYLCVCGPAHAGDNCQWKNQHSGGHPLTAPAAIAALTVSLLLLVVVGIVISIRLRRQWVSRDVDDNGVTDVDDETGEMRVVKCRGTDEGGGGGGGGESKTHLSASLPPQHDTYIECLKYSLAHTQPSHLPPPPPPPRSTATPEAGEVSSPSCCRPEVSVAAKPTTVKRPPPDPLLPRDDLRAYAYEGDGSSAGSLGSAKAGLRADPEEEGGIRPLVSEFLEVMDLLKNLPEASRSPSFLNKVYSKSSVELPAGEGKQEPDLQPTTTLAATPTQHRKPRLASCSSPQSREELSTAC